MYNRSYAEEKIAEKTADKKLFLALYSYLKPVKWALVIAVVFLLFARSIDVLVPAYLGKIVRETFGDDTSKPIEMSLAFFLFSLLIAGYFFDVISSYIKNFFGQKAARSLRFSVYRHLVSLPLSYFDKNPIGRLITKTIHDVDQIDQMFSESLVPLVGSLFTFAAIFVAVFFIDSQMALLLALVMPFLIKFTSYFREHQRRCYAKVRAILSALNGFIQENLLGMMTVKNFGLQKQEKKHFSEINDDYGLANIESMHYFSFFIAGIDFFQSVTLISAFFILGVFSKSGSAFDAGTFFAFSLYSLMIFRPILDIAERYNILQSAFAASERVFDVLKIAKEPSCAVLQKTIDKIESIEFQDVYFAYQAEDWILKGVSFKILKNQSVAIVGETGAGKSTVISLLLRFYTPQKGKILINGQAIENFSLESIRKLFGVVLQDPVIFTETLYENVALFDASITAPQVISALEMVGLKSFLEKHPQGVHQMLEGQGRLLSLGERQQVSLARAALNTKEVMLLDEATSNIDSITEKSIQKALDTLVKEKTAIVIAHRFSTIKNADFVLVFHKGKIVERGTHLELLAASGVYEKLSRLQFGKGGAV